MTKTIYEIQEEMETVLLIKKALCVSGERAHELLKEWTGEETSSITGGAISSDIACECPYEYEDEKVSFKGDVEFSKAKVTGLEDELEKVLKSLGFESMKSGRDIGNSLLDLWLECLKDKK